MRLLILGLCGLVAGGVFTAMLLSLLSTRRTPDQAGHFHQSAMVEFVWAAIPCLMVLAAAVPAVIAILSSSSGP